MKKCSPSWGTSSPSCAKRPIADIEAVAGPCVAEGIRRLRAGEVQRRAGFDGEYGTITLLTPAEIEQFTGQLSLFCRGSPATAAKALRVAKASRRAAAGSARPGGRHAQPRAAGRGGGGGARGRGRRRAGHGQDQNPGRAHRAPDRARGVKPDEITAVTFTNQAAAEMRERLEQRLGGKRAVRGMTIGTFHAICLHLLGTCA